MAIEKKKTLDAIVTAISGELGATPVLAPLKGFKLDGTFNPQRAMDKLQLGEVRDLARSAILVDSPAQGKEAAALLQAKGVEIGPGKNYFEQPSYLGYRGINGNHTDVHGVGEIQVNVPEMQYVKDANEVNKGVLGDLREPIKAAFDKAGIAEGEMHTIYEKVRPYELVAKKEGRMNKLKNGSEHFEWTPQEEKIVMPLIERSNFVADTAMKFAKERSKN